jgi:hypothetical protein
MINNWLINFSSFISNCFKFIFCLAVKKNRISNNQSVFSASWRIRRDEQGMSNDEGGAGHVQPNR